MSRASADLHDEPPLLNSVGDLSERIRTDCTLYGFDGWRSAGVAFNWLLLYICQLEKRVTEMEKRLES